MKKKQIASILQALLAAVLFGVSAPFAKLLLGDVEPIPLAAFLYLGSGIGLLGIKCVQRFSRKASDREAKVTKPDIPWLVGAVLAGGVAAPIVLLFSLRDTPAATASLLLNFESVATTLIAALVFKEAIGKRAWWAILAITLSSIFLSIELNGSWGLSLGAVGIVAACVFWGIDNNFTRNISAKDPLSIVTIKGLGAGSVSLITALVLGNRIPGLNVILGAMLLGCFSYGISIVLFIHAMRGLGAARTSALFGSAPIVGAVASILLFGEFPNWLFLLAMPLTIAGTLLLVNEDHHHAHKHEAVTHEHSHSHDDGHHDHDHGIEGTQRHSHVHTHPEMEHDHSHAPDLHHRHAHPVES